MSQVTDMTQRYDPFGSNSYSTASNPWAGFFGTPPFPYKTTSYDKYDRHNWNLPEAYVGQNKMLRSTMDELIYTDEDWYTTVALPYSFTDQTSVAWDKWEFNEHFTNIVPEQGVSRLVSSHKEQRTESFVRRGLAAIFEHGFMSTPEGRANYVLTLRQISRAVKETTNFGVIYAYLTAHNYNRTWEEKHGYFRRQTLTEILSRNKYMWAIAQKEKNGMEKLDAQIVEWMNRYRGEADTWILPPKMTIYLRLVPAHKTDYNIAGPMGPDRVNNISGAGRPHEQNAPSKRIHDVVEPYAVFAKNKVYITRTYHVDRTGPIDLMARVSQIGEYNVMLSDKECITDDYRSCNRSIRIYDETNDRGVTLSIQDALDSCNLFGQDGKIKSIGESNDEGDVRDLLSDFTLRQVSNPMDGSMEFKPITHFGDISEQFVSVKSIGKIAQTVINSFLTDSTERRTAEQELEAGMSIIKQLNMTQFRSAEDARFNSVATINAGRNVGGAGADELAATTKLAAAGFAVATAVAAGANNDVIDGFGAAGITADEIAVATEMLNNLGAVDILDRDGGVLTSAAFTNNGEEQIDLAGATSWDALNMIVNNAATGTYIARIRPKIARFVAQIENLATRMSAILGSPDNLFLSPANAGPWNRNQSAPATLYENLVNYKAVPVFRLGAAAGAAPAAGAGPAAGQTAAQMAPLRTALRTMRQGFAEVGPDAARLTANGVLVNGAPTAAYRAVLGQVNAIVAADGTIADPARVTAADLTQLADLLRNNQPMTRSDTPVQLAEWLGDIQQAYAEALGHINAEQVRPGAAAPAAVNYDAATMTVLMAYYENPSFMDGGAGRFGRQQDANLGWDLASRFDLTRVRDAERAVVGAAGARRHLALIGSQFDANEMPLFRGLATAEQFNNREQSVAAQRDDAFRIGSGLAHFQPVGRMMNLDVDRVQDEAVWIPRAGGALAMAAGAGGVERLNTRIGNIAFLLNKLSGSPMSVLQKLAGAAYLGAPAEKPVFDAMVQANVIVPLNFIVARPHARYEMALGIKTKAGLDTGATYFGHSNFMLSDDATVKVHYGNYTHYGKSVVHQEKHVFVAYDIFSNAAIGGLGVRPYIHGRGHNNTQYNPDMAQQANQGYGADMFVFAMPYDERDIPNPLDVSGRFYSYMDKGFIDAEDPTANKLHFTTAARYNRMWGFYNPANVMDEIDEPLYRTQYANVNRVCWQGAQGGYNPETKKFDKIIRNTGHWGPDVAVGVKSARDGRMHEIEKVPFGVLGF